MKIMFEIMGKPKGKERPRFSKNKVVYSPIGNITYENAVKLNYKKASGQSSIVYFPKAHPIKMIIQAIYEIPKRASAKNRESMLNGKILPTKKPDTDNIAKVIADSLNKYAYYDDAQIAKMEISKQYGESSKVIVILESIGEINNE